MSRTIRRASLRHDLLGGKPKRKGDYRAVPRVTFTDPEVGAVGLTEAQANDDGLDVRVGRADLATTSRGWIHRTGNAGIVKLVADADIRRTRRRDHGRPDRWRADCSADIGDPDPGAGS